MLTGYICLRIVIKLVHIHTKQYLDTPNARSLQFKHGSDISILSIHLYVVYNYITIVMNRILLISVLFVMLAANFTMDYIAFEQQKEINGEVNEFHYGVIDVFEYLLPNTEHEEQELYI